MDNPESRMRRFMARWASLGSWAPVVRAAASFAIALGEAPHRSARRFAMTIPRRRLLPGPSIWALIALATLATPAQLTAFEVVDSITLEAGELPDSAVIDPAGQFAYFGTWGNQVVKIDLETFERVDAITGDGGSFLTAAAIDPAGNFAYFTGLDGFSCDTAATIEKIDLATFEVAEALPLEPGENNIIGAAIDPAGEFAYFGTVCGNEFPGELIKVDLQSFEAVDKLTFEQDESRILTVLIDPEGEFAYVTSFRDLGDFGSDKIIKIDLETFEPVDSLTLEQNESRLESAVMDPEGHFAYYGTGWGDHVVDPFVVKIDLETFERVGVINLESGVGEDDLRNAVMDPVGEFAYFGTFVTTDEPATVVKIDLAIFEKVDTLTMDPGEGLGFTSAAIDPIGEFAYFGTWEDPGRVVKVCLGDVCEGAPTLSFDPSSLDFGDVPVGETSAPQMATLANTGGTDATGVTFSGLPAMGFEADTSACGDILPAGGSCDVGVTFTPQVPGPANATLHVDSNEGATADLGLSGNGVELVLTPASLELQDASGNGIWELGEATTVVTAWTNEGGTGATGVTASAAASAGVALSDGTAQYGDIPAGATRSCLDGGDCYDASAVGPRPGTHWDATLSATLSTGHAHDWVLHVGESFDDVPPSHPFYRFVETILHGQVTAGCSATDYCPSSSTTRAQMAVFVLVAKEGPGYAPPACQAGSETFGDVPASSPFCPWVEELARRGVVVGCGGGNYCPDQAVSRAQSAVFDLATLEGGDYTPPACQAGSESFEDVPASSPFCPWVEEFARRGITAGCSADPPLFCPTSPVTRGQMAVFVTATFGLELYVP